MRITLLVRCVVFGAALSAAAACGGSGSTGGGGGSGGGFAPSGFSCSGAKPRYSTDVAPIFAAHCAGVEGCHVTMHDAGQAYAYLVNQDVVLDGSVCKGEIRVIPKDPEHSDVIHKITNTNMCGGVPMPNAQGGQWEQLPAPIIQTIYDWICEGAKQD